MVLMHIIRMDIMEVSVIMLPTILIQERMREVPQPMVLTDRLQPGRHIIPIPERQPEVHLFQLPTAQEVPGRLTIPIQGLPLPRARVQVLMDKPGPPFTITDMEPRLKQHMPQII